MSKQIVDLCDYVPQLRMFREYVTGFIEAPHPRHEGEDPKSFADWYESEYLRHINEHTQVITFTCLRSRKPLHRRCCTAALGGATL